MSKTPDERGPFGQFLFRQLKVRHQKSAQWLADELKALETPIDASLLRRWMSGDRVPTEGHDVIPNVAVALKCPLAEVNGLHKEALKWVKQKKADKLHNRKKISRHDSTKLLERLAPSIKSNSHAVNDLYNACENLRVGEKSIGVTGERENLETVICFLEGLPSPPHEGSKLYFMMQGRTATIEAYADDLLPRWYGAMRSALEKGWTVMHVVRLDDDLERIKKLIRGILLLVGQEGEYIPMVFKQKFVLPVAESFMIVPSLHKGMIFYSTKKPGYVDSGIYIEDEVQVGILAEHFRLLRAESMNRIFHIENQYSDVIPHLQRADKVPGNRIVILKRLSDIQRPESSYSEKSSWAKTHQRIHKLDLEELCQCLKVRKLRQKALHSHSLSHSCRYLYTNSCIDSFFMKGKEVSLPNYTASVSNRLEQLSVFQKLLEYPHYEMALSEETIYTALNISDDVVEPVRFPDIIPDFCEVQENYFALMQIPIRKGLARQHKYRWIIIEEPVIVKAFYQYLSDIWELRIPQHRKDKFQINRWLEHQKQHLEVTKSKQLKLKAQ